ncbi:MAG: outer membrane lipoprotein-sorting protein [Bacteriovoracaceae bacterium]|nr:outer membrane lipoprotein-sorting protein [Bacteriovoracaceae bacterium]
MKFTLLFFITINAWCMSAREIMEKVDKANKGIIGASGEMSMTLIDAQANKVERLLKAQTLEGNAQNDKSILEFIKPLDVKGVKLLTHTIKDDANKQWLYLPRFKRVKKINSRNQSCSFMASEFSYEDIAGRQLDKYSYKLLKEDDSSWTIESTPKTKSGYTKLISIINKEYMNPVKTEYYDRRSELLKVAIMSKFEPHKVKDKTFHLAKTIHMKNQQTKKESILTWNNRSLGVSLKESDFKSTKLK